MKLCWRKDEKQPSQVAIKFIRRESIPKGSERESKVHREINALKRLSHPNIIKLEEVLQNDKYIGIVLEYASGGELFDYILQHRYLKDSLACRLFAQLVSGVHYMHSKGIVHRDLKLENLLLDKHKNIVITDFGFVNSFSTGNELMKTSCGSPCYAAPELVISNEPYEARKVDIWSCGVILYAMLAGYLPFDDDPQNPDGDNIARLYQYITTTPLTFPEFVEPMARDLLRRVLVPNPQRRLNLREVRSHQWLSPHAPFLSVTPSEWDVNSSGDMVQQVIAQPVKNDYRRYSLIEQPFHHQQKPAFYANPLPPQTSSNHAIALPSSASSTSIHEQFKFSPRGHTRSNSVQSYSSATMALQAVVDADDVRYQTTSQPMPSSSSIYSFDNVRRNSGGEGKKSPYTFGGASIPRSTTHTGITSLSNPLKDHLMQWTIQESPVKQPPSQQQSQPDFAVPKIPMNSNNYHAANNQKLPGPRGGKPRPTSYHPGLYSADNTAHNILEPIYAQSNTQAGYNAGFTRSESTHSVASVGNYKLSKPSVDMVQAEGDIMNPKSPVMTSKTLNISSLEAEQLEQLVVDENANELKTDAIKEIKSQNRYSAIIVAEVFLGKLFGTAEKEEPEKQVESELAKLDSLVSSIHTTHSKPSNVSTITRNTSVQGTPQNQRKPSNPKSTASANKTKRFSLLGFYTSQPDTHSSVSGNKKKALEPSNGTNIDVKKKVSVVGYTSFERTKEPSAAKKVMDFFKRRSMRV